MRRKGELVAVAVMLGIALVATGTYFLQGGFGAGHGRFDVIVALPALPWALLLEAAPLPRFIEQYDLLLIIWFPTLLNLVVVFTVAGAVRRCAAKRVPPPGEKPRRTPTAARD